ncbi:hypothetical protein KR222_003507 [Zaprionus bogoriensis]|nr:hypothetical protein KR222_003507 [Zaprionus bogoriensis]
MKFCLILACLALYVAHTQAQSSCRGSVPEFNQTCVGGLNEGHSRWARCRRNWNADMWYYDQPSRLCFQMSYRGCGGNNNRYCTLENCRWQCRRS